MSRKTLYCCDRCGKEIRGRVFTLANFYGGSDLPEDLWELEKGADLCEECFNIVDDATRRAIQNQMMPGMRTPEDTEKDAAEKPARRSSVEIDMGKVFALRKAGWSLEKIGEEFHVSGQTIANKIKAAEQEE